MTAENAMQTQPDLDAAFGPAPSAYDRGFRDAVESFIAAGVTPATVLSVLDAFGNHAPESCLDPEVRVLLDQALQALTAALPFLGTHEPGPTARMTDHQTAGALARTAIACLGGTLEADPAVSGLDHRARVPVTTSFVPTRGEVRHVRLVSADGLIVGQCEDGVYAAGDGEQNARWLAAVCNKTRALPLELLESPAFALTLVRRPQPPQLALALEAG